MTEPVESMVITVNHLHQKIAAREILRDLTFDVRRGECLGIFGLRGSGKTSLLHILAGIDRFSSGMVEILGCSLGGKDSSFMRHVGLVTQFPSLFHDLTVAENLDYIALLKGCGTSQIQSLCESLELGPYLREAAVRLEVSVYQRLALACALLNQPDILIVDEIIKDIDLASRQLIVNQLNGYRQAGGTCIWGFSHMYYNKWVDRVAWLEDAQISLYSPQEAVERWQEQVLAFSAGGEEL
ncbi:MAG TPA: ATP-binding cassette domain-containing protein [Syntrophomonadaceae bacterium]|nr:ATP-binding cassette domain-containing protein [Syntrophomonadaceae bacterium]